MRVLAVLASLLVLAGCGIQPSGVITGDAAPRGDVAPGNPAGPMTILYLVSSEGGLSPVRLTIKPLSPADTLALLASPAVEKRAPGLTTEVPTGAEFVVSTDASGKTEVALSTSADQLSSTAVAQIVCTAAAAVPAVPTHVTVVGARYQGPWRCPQ
ncbi:hypothetical protein ACFQV2_13820 [Actinokineospora soli]|uniref:Sporulation and spore germination n=1 Tax=Actinokineospora soli TaxID=1048753 RepID=A0ABW2TMH7_9PSEU